MSKYLPSKSLLTKYANLVIKLGINLKKGDKVYLSSNVENYEFTRIVVDLLYKYKASDVIVDYVDEHNSKSKFTYASMGTITSFPKYLEEKYRAIADLGYSLIRLESNIPEIFKGIDQNKILEFEKSRYNNEVFKNYRTFVMGSIRPWSIIAVPNNAWAKKVFPDLNERNATKALWNAIFKTCRIAKDKNPIVENNNHFLEMKTVNEKLNKYNFKHLQFVSKISGTNLKVGLVEGHIWSGGAEISANNRIFAPNLPTEETFSMPDKYNINGVVYSTMPLEYRGVLINDFNLVFKDGLVVEAHAKVEEEALLNLLKTDEGSARLGEVALVPYGSPINSLNLLFYNTLFDENASCHLALGNSYPNNMVGGEKMSDAEAEAKHSNRSNIHVDFMFGTSDMSVVGTTHSNEQIIVFQNGKFVI